MLFRHSDAQFLDAFNRALARLGIQGLGIVPHSIRHSGPSDDFRSGKRDLVAIKFRGRWRSDGSVRRYTKATRAMTMAHLIPEPVLSFGARIRGSVAELFQRGGTVPPPPAVARLQ